MRIWCMVLLGVVYALSSVVAVRVWRSPEALWAHAASATPHSVRAMGNHLRYQFAAGADVEGR